MMELHLSSVLYTIVQYLALGRYAYALVTMATNVKGRPLDEVDNFQCVLLLNAFAYMFLTLFLFLFKCSNDILLRDDFVLPVLCVIVIVLTMGKVDGFRDEAVALRSVCYMAQKYKLDSAQVALVVKTFGISRFPIDRFEELLALTKAQCQAKTIDDVEVLTRAKSTLDHFSTFVEAHNKAVTFRKNLKELDQCGGSDNKSGKRYS